MSCTLTLPPELTIYTVAQLRPRWLECAGAAGHWQADGSAVDDVDAAGVQLLMSLSSALDQGQGSLAVVNPSAVLASACEVLGAAALLGGRTRAGGDA